MLIKLAAKKAQYLFIEKSWLVYGIFLAGIIVRIYELGKRSFWYDEALLANPASSDSISSAFFNATHTPPLFLSTLFASVHIFPNNEWSLRIIPVLFSIGGMVLIYLLVRKWLGKIEAVGALLLFSFMPVIFTYSIELRQYTCDIFFILLLLFIMERILDNPHSGRLWTILAVTGSVGLWFSYPVAYVLASAGISLLYHIFYDECSKPEKRKLLLYWFFTLSAILLSIGFLYYFVISSAMGKSLESEFSRSVNQTLSSAFFPDLSGIGAFIKWFGLSVWSYFEYFWNGYTAIVSIISLAGGWHLYRTGRIRILFYWGIIFLALLIASFMHIFPFSGFRVTLFTAPIFIILFVSGLKALWVYSKNYVFLKPLAYLALVLLAVQLLDAAVYYKNGKGYFWHKQFPETEDIKTVLQLLDEKRKNNEPVYIYYGAVHAFKYYSKYRYKKSYSPIMIGKRHRREPSLYIAELEPLYRNREAFWILGTHVRKIELQRIHYTLIGKLGYQSRFYYSKDNAFLVYYYPQN